MPKGRSGGAIVNSNRSDLPVLVGASVRKSGIQGHSPANIDQVSPGSVAGGFFTGGTSASSYGRLAVGLGLRTWSTRAFIAACMVANFGLWAEPWARL